MSDNFLTVIPADPYWQPGQAQADHAAAMLSGMLPDDDARRGMEATWCENVEVVHCGTNLDKISCSGCAADLGTSDWWGETVSARHRDGFPTLLITTPCCGAETSLNELVYDWPMGFARFRIEVLYPNRGWLTDEELTSVAGALGHPLRQILAHF
ncbi:hypothetical protein [Streptomyces brasiliensis]|nr:hypothetical protein [Streptomyces brasiliensis]